MNYQDTHLWKNTLGEQDGDDQDAKARARLRNSFEEFRSAVEPLGKEVALSVPGYTDHSIEHCDSLWDTASLIAGTEFPLTPAEAFVLGGSFLVHDLAMGLAAYSGGLPQLINSEQWRDLLWAEWSDRAAQLQAQLEADVELDPTWNGITSPAVKSTLTTFLREHHAEEAEELLKNQWELSSGETFYLLSNPEIRHWYSEVIGKVARSHWLDVHDIEGYVPRPFGAPAFLPQAWTVDPVKVACLLRLADAAHIDSRRAHPLHMPFRQPQGESVPHWDFQGMMLLPQESEGRLVFSSSKSFGPEFADAWWLAYDTVAMINGELQGVDSLCADQGRPRMLCRSAAGAEEPERFAKYVPTSHWNPIDARPRIRNPIRVIESLGGRALYGDDDDVPIRELLANATDASTARVAAQGGSASVPPVKVNFYKVAGDYFVTIRDYGIGMSADDIARHLCDFGSSGWRSKKFRSDYPGALSSGYSSTGKFGIGFFSAFMIATDVTVTTRSLQGGWDDTYCLEFREGLSHRPIMRRAEKSERLHEPGTQVTLRLTQDPTRFGGLLHSEQVLGEQRDLLFIRSLAFTARHPIDVSPLHSDEWFSAVDSQPWYEKSASDIFLAAHWDPYDRMPEEAHLEALNYFTESLEPLHGENDEVVGMLCSTAIRVGWRTLPYAAGYCGGFRSGNVGGVSGVLEGQTIRASRDRITVPTSLEKMQDWVERQWAKNRPPVREVSDIELLRFHSYSIGFGIEKKDAPIAVTKTGVLTVDELEPWIATRDSFYLSDRSIPSLVELPDSGQWIYNSNDLLQLSEDSLAVSFELRNYDDGFPSAEFENPFEDDWIPGVGPQPQVAEAASSWFVEQNTPAGSAIKAASRAWGVPLRDLILAIEVESRELQGTPEDPARSYSGNSFQFTWRTIQRPITES